MRKFDWTKGALALTAGSVLAIGAGNVAADNSQDIDDFEVEVEVWEPVEITDVSEPNLDDDGYAPGAEATDDFTATVEGEEGAGVTVTYTSEGEMSDTDDITVTLPDNENVTLDGGDAGVGGEFSADLDDGTTAGKYTETVTITADYEF
ncbi:hypothetical protein LRF89_10370 [Halorhodospira sp. 9621]|uniref:hypothetical protein n=1 Tax=Halorhodospira sp. 9621 TaxID=2899135 RepID=UPI001EE90598|nr:hypothetical protein [Halorhodospira sp. 9621]MCG5533839.1 hypothetical protein [Halorhodospira sp. 9621]